MIKYLYALIILFVAKTGYCFIPDCTGKTYECIGPYAVFDCKSRIAVYCEELFPETICIPGVTNNEGHGCLSVKVNCIGAGTFSMRSLIPSRCDLFYTCVNTGLKYDLEIHACESGLQFNETSNKCEINVCDTTITTPTIPPTTPTTPAPPECSNTTLLPHPTDCNMYYECISGKIFTKSCPFGLYFNQTSAKCEKSRFVCKCENGEYYVLSQCRTYHKCVNNVWLLNQTCLFKYFNIATKLCENEKPANCPA